MKIIKSLLPFGFILLCLIKTTAQTDSLKHKYNNQTISRYGSYFLKGNERLTYKDLPNEFSKSELSIASFRLAKKNKTIFKVYNFLSIGCALAAVGVIRNNRDLAYGFIGGQVGFIFLGARHGQLSNQHLDRALWLYNKEVLFPEKPR